MISRPLQTTLTMLGCLSLTCGVAWLHYTRSEPVFEAHARLRLAARPDESASTEQMPAVDASEDPSRLPATIVAATLELLRQRDFQIALNSPLDSESSELASRVQVVTEDRAGHKGVALTYTTTDSTEAVPVLTAVVDAYVKSQSEQVSGPPAPALTEMQTKAQQLSNALAAEQARLTAARTNLAQSSTTEAGRLISTEKLKTLSSAAADAQRRRLEAEARLIQARQEIEAGTLPIELLISRLPEGPTRSLVHEALTRSGLRDKLERQLAVHQRLAAVYGRNHPQLVECRQNLEALESQLKASETSASGEAIDESPAALLVGSLQSELKTFQTMERDLHEQINAESAGVDAHARLAKDHSDAELAVARLKVEQDAAQRLLEAAQHNQADQAASIVEPPSLASEPVAPVVWKELSFGIGAGLILGCLACWALAPLDVPEQPLAIAGKFSDAVARAHTEQLSLEERRKARMQNADGLRAA